MIRPDRHHVRHGHGKQKCEYIDADKARNDTMIALPIWSPAVDSQAPLKMCPLKQGTFRRQEGEVDQWVKGLTRGFLVAVPAVSAMLRRAFPRRVSCSRIRVARLTGLSARRIRLPLLDLATQQLLQTDQVVPVRYRLHRDRVWITRSGPHVL